MLLKSFTCTPHLSDLFESLKIHICKNVALRKREDLEGNCTVMVLQGRYVIVSHCQLCAGIDLIPDSWMIQANGLVGFTVPRGFFYKWEDACLSQTFTT